ncbi:MAG: chemotaxis protein CheW [Desulfobulbus sp.]
MASQQRHQDARVFLMPMDDLECTQNISFLFSQTQVVEILGNRPIQKIPFSPRHVLGIIAYQGRSLPVINLPDLCGRASEAGRNRYKQLMVVRTTVSDPESGEPLKVALATNAAIRILKLSSQALTNSFIQKQAPDWLTASIGLRGFFQWGDECVALVQLNNVALGNDVPSAKAIGR